MLTLDNAPVIGAIGATAAPAAGDHPPAKATTTTAGTFEFPAVSAGTYVLAVRRLGYAPVETLIELAPGGHHATLALEAVTMQLPEVVIEGTPAARHLAAVGYFDRRKLGFGRFMDAAEISRHNAIDVVSFFRPMIQGCTMIYIDGLPRALREITLPEIAAFELYTRRAAAPPQFQNPHLDCGSLVVWTWLSPPTAN
jgi:hypothetical protein